MKYIGPKSLERFKTKLNESKADGNIRSICKVRGVAFNIDGSTTEMATFITDDSVGGPSIPINTNPNMFTIESSAITINENGFYKIYLYSMGGSDGSSASGYVVAITCTVKDANDQYITSVTSHIQSNGYGMTTSLDNSMIEVIQLAGGTKLHIEIDVFSDGNSSGLTFNILPLLIIEAI